jgi:hypothetical protein
MLAIHVTSGGTAGREKRLESNFGHSRLPPTNSLKNLYILNFRSYNASDPSRRPNIFIEAQSQSITRCQRDTYRFLPRCARHSSTERRYLVTVLGNETRRENILKPLLQQARKRFPHAYLLSHHPIVISGFAHAVLTLTKHSLLFQ